MTTVTIDAEQLFALGGALFVAADRVALVRGAAVDAAASVGRDIDGGLFDPLHRTEATLRARSEDVIRRAADVVRSQEVALAQEQALEFMRIDFVNDGFRPDDYYERLSFDEKVTYFLLSQMGAASWPVPPEWVRWSLQQRLDYFAANAADITCQIAREPWVCEHQDGLLQVFGTIAMVAGTLADGLTIAQQLARPGVVPLGFANRVEFETFGNKLMRGVDEGYPGADAAFQGSSVTGFRFRDGMPFDVGRVSDFDIALAGDDIFEAAIRAGAKLRGNGTRTEPLKAMMMQRMGLDTLQQELMLIAGRDVKFMVYRDIAVALARRPSVVVP